MSDSYSECIFCDIIQGKKPSKQVYEDELVVAFWDANPAAALHILIVPREHIPTLNDIPPDNKILAHLGQVASRIAADFGVAEPGYRFVINVNPGGGQMVFHLHAHLVSRTWREPG
ncbi:MAG: histidine triad nucleotide-binding protein [Desulfomonile tiedjei]|nr:histidine triad nucleotide-binding protein [Desulfomonile tiedjei]